MKKNKVKNEDENLQLFIYTNYKYKFYIRRKSNFTNQIFITLQSNYELNMKTLQMTCSIRI